MILLTDGGRPLILLDKPSFQSLFLEVRNADGCLATATGFIVLRPDGSPLLMTNWHIVTGRHHDTRQPLARCGEVPDVLRIYHNVQEDIGNWVAKTERLYDDSGDPLWLEDPVHGPNADVVGLPLTDIGGVECYPYSYSGPSGHDVASLPVPTIKWGPSDFVNIIGFPFGWKGGGSLGIWVQGAIATEPVVDYKNLPRFLIDSRTRPGQSGSPVVIYKRNGWVTLGNGQLYMIHNPLTLLVGIYSGRLSLESDLGTVWKTSVISAIAEHGKRGIRP
ncbi:MAG: trypsin-like peptidase domain-containing protein [Syntrophobacteraceae bacterium]